MSLFKSNKEFDGTVFLAVMLVSFYTVIWMVYLKPEFATSQGGTIILEIIKAMFLVMVGYLFRKGQEALEEFQKRKQQGDDNRD